MAQWGDTDTLADAPKYLTPSVTFDASNTSIVVTADDEIVIPEHGLATGERVTYSTAGTPITGLTGGNMYYVIRVNADKISLAADHAAAHAGTAIVLTAGATGTADVLKVTPHNDDDDHSTVLFVDTTEATIAGNRDKGIKTPGWNSYRTYTTGDGRTRHIVEPLVAMKRTAVDAGDAGVTGNTADEDAFVADS